VPKPRIPHPTVTLDDLAGRAFAEVWEVASILDADPRTVRSAIRRGDIPHVRAGREYRVPVAWLREQARVPS
jgi:excisionase family DNA binding protein